MKGCAKIREQLSAFIDGDLTPEEIKAVEGHLAECPSCSAALADLHKVVGHLHELEQVEPPPWFTQKVMARVRTLESTPERKGLFKWFFQPLYIKAPIGALATAILAVTTYFIFQGIIKDMPVERSVQDSERPQQIAIQEKAPAPAAKKTYSDEQIKQGASKANDELREKAVEKSVKIYEPAMKPEIPAYKARTDSAPESAAGYAPAPQERYKATASASMPELKGNVAEPAQAPVPARGAEYEETGKVTKAKRAMSAGASRSQSYDKAVQMRDEDSYPASKQYRPLMAEKAPVSFHIVSDDPAAAGRQVVAAANEYHGSNIKTEIMGDKTIVRAELKVSWLPMFFDSLKKAGLVKEKTAPVFSDVSSVKITVEIIGSN